MGLLKAGTGAVGGVLADQWREFFYCESLDANTLAAKGQKRTSAHGRSSNTRTTSFPTVRSSLSTKGSA